MGPIDLLLALLKAKAQDDDDEAEYLTLKHLLVKSLNPQISFEVDPDNSYMKTLKMAIGMVQYPARSALRITNYLGKEVFRFFGNGSLQMSPLDQPEFFMGGNETDYEAKDEFSFYLKPTDDSNGKFLFFGGNDESRQLDGMRVLTREFQVEGNARVVKAGAEQGGVSVDGDYRYNDVHEHLEGRLFEKVLGPEEYHPIVEYGAADNGAAVLSLDPFGPFTENIGIRMPHSEAITKAQFVIPVNLPDGAVIMMMEAKVGFVGLGASPTQRSVGLTLYRKQLEGSDIDHIVDIDVNCHAFAAGAVVPAQTVPGSIAAEYAEVRNSEYRYAIVGTLLNTESAHFGNGSLGLFGFKVVYRLAALRPA